MVWTCEKDGHVQSLQADGGKQVDVHRLSLGEMNRDPSPLLSILVRSLDGTIS